jgi:hypothetical protein
VIVMVTMRNDDDDDARPTTAIRADELRGLVTRARDADVEAAPAARSARATEAVAPIVIIVDRPATVIDGLIKSAGRAATRLVTLSKFRALRREVVPAPPEAPATPIAPPLAACAGEVVSTHVALSPPVTLYEARGGAAVVAAEALTISSGADSATLHARPMVSIVGFPKMRLPTNPPEPVPELPASAFEPPPAARDPHAPVMLDPHHGPGFELAPAGPAPRRLSAAHSQQLRRRVVSAGGVALVPRSRLDGYALAAIAFVAGAAAWMWIAY